MFEKFSFEYQVNKRIRTFLCHTATENNIEPGKAKLLFRLKDGTLSIHVYEGGRHVKPLPFSGILEFFGQDYNERYATSVSAYLQKLSDDEQIPLPNLYVVICETNETIGAHLYDGIRYKKKISVLDLISQFTQHDNG